MIEKPARGEVCETPRFSSTQLKRFVSGWLREILVDSLGFGQQRILPLQIFFHRAVTTVSVSGQWCFFHHFCGYRLALLRRIFGAVLARFGTVTAKFCSTSNWLQYGKAQVRPKIRTTLIVCHFKFLKSGQIVLNSKFAPHRPAKQRPEKNHRKLALKTKHRRLRENFRAAGSVPAWVSHPPDSPVLVGIVFGSMSNYKLRTFYSSKSSNTWYIIRTRLCVFLKCSEPPQWRWNLSILPPRYSVRCNQPWEIVWLCIMDLQAFGFWCLILMNIDSLIAWLLDWLID